MIVDGAEVRCGGCREVVYLECRVMANHTITWLSDGRVRWYSRDMQVVVHLCDEAHSIHAEAQRVLEGAR